MKQCRSIAVIGVIAGAASLSLSAAASAGTNPVAGLGRLLPRTGEMTGFRASGPVYVLGTIAKDVALDPAVIRKSDAANLANDSFVTELVQNQVGTENGQAGVGKKYGTGALTRLGSHTAALAYAKFVFSTIAKPGPVGGSAAQVRYERFAVPGVPSAEGVAEVTRHKDVAHANVHGLKAAV